MLSLENYLPDDTGERKVEQMNNVWEAVKKYLNDAKEYIQSMDVSDMTLVKLCVLALGILSGAAVSEKHKKAVVVVAVLIFIVTYIPVMVKFFGKMVEKKELDT